MLGVAEQALGGILLGFGIDKASELSRRQNQKEAETKFLQNATLKLSCLMDNVPLLLTRHVNC